MVKNLIAFKKAFKNPSLYKLPFPLLLSLKKINLLIILIIIPFDLFLSRLLSNSFNRRGTRDIYTSITISRYDFYVSDNTSDKKTLLVFSSCLLLL
jgi:hypothetical protein